MKKSDLINADNVTVRKFMSGGVSVTGVGS